MIAQIRAQEFDMVTPNDTRIILSLLHPTKGYPIQQWQFEGAAVIRIGRAFDNEVTIADQHVSRRHAELRFDSGIWELRNLGRHGTMFEGRSVQQTTLARTAVFHLGPGGPTLEFRENPAKMDDQTTVLRNIDLADSLAIDKNGRDRELEQIVESPFFQRLQENAASLRRKRTEAGKRED